MARAAKAPSGKELMALAGGEAPNISLPVVSRPEHDDVPVLIRDDAPSEDTPSGDPHSGAALHALAGAGEDEGFISQIGEAIGATGIGEGVTEFGTQFGAGVSDVIGPINPLRRLDAFKPGPDFEPTPEPDTAFGRAGRLSGQTFAVTPILGVTTAALPLAAPAAEGASRLKKIGKGALNLLPQGGRTFLRTPGRALTVETGLGVTAGLAGHAAVEVYPDSPAAKVAAEIFGGVAPQFMPLPLAIRTAGAMRDKMVARGTTRALDRVERAVPEGQRSQAASKLDEDTTLDPVTGLPVIPTALRTELPGLLALERAVMDSSDELRTEIGDQIFKARQAIQASAEEIGKGGRRNVAEATIEEQQAYLSALQDERLAIAAQRMDERIRALGPKATVEQVNRIATEEIESALEAAVAQQKQLYAAIAEDAVTPTTNATTAYREILADLSRAERKDIPKEAREFLDPKTGFFFKKADDAPIPGALQLSPFAARAAGAAEEVIEESNDTTIKEMRGLYGKLREVARNERAGRKVNRNKARIADKLADAIDEDIANTKGGPGVAEAVNDAKVFTKALKDRFSRGEVGKLLGRDVRGGREVPESLTLEQSIGATGPGARQAFDDIKAAFDSPEAPSSQVTIGAMEDYMRAKFRKDLVRDDGIGDTIKSVSSAENWMVQNGELLNRMPVLRDQMEAAIAARSALELEQTASKGLATRIETSKATVYLNREPDEAFRQISKLSPAKASAEVQSMLDDVARDSTGEATVGLTASFRDYLLGAATKNNPLGERVVSGFKLEELLNQPSLKAAAKKLFSEDEFKRLDVIVNDLKRLERFDATAIPIEGIIGDTPSMALESIVGIFGAATGRRLGRVIGAGGTVQIPGLVASHARALLRSGIHDPAARFIADAVRDEELFKAVFLTKWRVGDQMPREVSRKLNAWMAVVLAEHGVTFQEDLPPEGMGGSIGEDRSQEELPQGAGA